MSKHKITNYLNSLTPEQSELIFGSPNADSLRYGFKSKRTVHPGVGSRPIMPVQTQSVWQQLINSPASDKARVAYIHIPFCSRRCSYCGFFQNMNTPDNMNLYTAMLVQEIQQSAAYQFVNSAPLQAVYFGGGTPSALSATNIADLLAAVKANLNLAIDCEITFESSIHELDAEKFALCLEHGINRFSFGVQSFNSKVRQSVGRIDDREQLLNALTSMLHQEQASIVIDLMYGLPYQTPEVWADDLALQFKLGLHGGDLYQLNIFPNSALDQAILNKHLPAAAKLAEQAEMYAYAIQQIKQTPAIKRLSVCHWASSSKERSLYNRLSLGGADIIPFGAGAGGFIAGHSIMCDRNLVSYLARSKAGEKPLMGILTADAQGDLYKEITGQLDRGYLDLNYFANTYNLDFAQLLEPLFSSWQEKQFIYLEAGQLKLTVAGQFWYVNLTQAILDCLQAYFRQADAPAGHHSFMTTKVKHH